MQSKKRVLIMGAAGRDFHNFNVYFRDNPEVRVEAFTAHQIPGIAGRRYPVELAGGAYPEGIPIFDEAELPELIGRLKIDEVLFAYSDVSHLDVMHRAALVNSLGADFRLMGWRSTMLKAAKPVISVCAVRTGCGKSQTSRRLTELLRRKGKSVVVIRHPMPYGEDLNIQRCQRFETVADLDRHKCTIEEREEYEAHIGKGHIVYAGVDYAVILRKAEQEADILLWDGGNNDIPFLETDLHIVLVDPHRPGHEVLYHPGETNLRMAHVVLVSKTGNAAPEAIAQVTSNVRSLNPGTRIIRADSVLTVSDPGQIRGKRVLAVEDGPTLTHGGMTYGAAHVAARRYGAAAIVDPRPYLSGSLRETFLENPHLTDVLPAMGYGADQVQDLQTTIDRIPCDVVLVGTPFDLGRLIRTHHPLVRVGYSLDQGATDELDRVLDAFIQKPHDA